MPESFGSNNREGLQDLYSVLMAARKESEMWKEADSAGDHGLKPTQASRSRRKAPFYKVLQGMPIAVDAFRYGTIPGVSAYFLTHAHSDHYTNLSSSWKSGPIYCSEGTANLIIHMLSVDRKWVHPLPMDTPTVIPDTGGVSVTLIEANHCPGSCLFFFEGLQTINAGDSVFMSSFVGSPRVFRYLHCGDFRASPRHVLHPAIRGKPIDHIYLDTTYLDPKYVFPPQPQVIHACAELARRVVAGDLVGPVDAKGRRDTIIESWVNSHPQHDGKEIKLSQGRTLVAIGTYSIGKERIVKAIAQALQTKVYCDARKAAILLCQSDQQLHDLLTSDPLEGGVHLLPLGLIMSDKLKYYLQRFEGTFSRVIGFRPTGWTYTPPAGSKPNPTIPAIISHGQARLFSYADLRPAQKATYEVQLYGVPYSEHSSFFELTCFAMSCDWGKIIPTVNVGSGKTRAKMSQWIQRWEAEKKRGKSSLVQPRAEDYW
ncbi:DRMBL-domain-containing protein [Scleroderma citrinum]